MLDSPGSGSPPQPTHFRDPFRLLKAVLIGVSIGFIAVMLRPYVRQASDGSYRLAMPNAVKEGNKALSSPAPVPPAVSETLPKRNDGQATPTKSPDSQKKIGAASLRERQKRARGLAEASKIADAGALPEDRPKPPSTPLPASPTAVNNDRREAIATPSTPIPAEKETKLLPPSAPAASRLSAPPGEEKDANAAPSPPKAAPEGETKPQQPSAAAPAAPVETPSEKQDANAAPATPPVTPAEEANPQRPPVIIPALDVTYPKPFSTTEMTEALQPLLAFKLSSADLAALKDVLSTANRGMDAQRAAIRKISDPSARKFAEWKVLRASQADLPIQLAFWTANPLFPGPALDNGTERALFMANVAPSDVLKFYAARRPSTGPGKASLGAAYMASGDRDRGSRLIRQAWARHEFDPEAEARYLGLFGALLTDDDKTARAAFLTARGLRKESALRRVSLESASAAGVRAVSRVMAQRAQTRAAAQTTAASRSLAVRNGRNPYRATPAKQLYRRLPVKSGRRRVEGPESRMLGLSRYALMAPSGMVSEASWRWPNRRPISAQGGSKPNDAAPAAQSGAGSGDASKGKETGNPDPVAKLGGNAAKPEQTPQPQKPAPQSAQVKLAGQAIKLVKEVQADSATLLARLNALKRQKADRKLWSILRSAKAETADLADPERWWDFRRNEARRVLNLGKPKTAYGIAKVHAPLDEEFASEAEFLSGWLALRSLKLPQIAKRHFEAAKAANGSPRDQARSAYWLAQAELALKQSADAETHLQEAGRRWFAFYGALAISSNGASRPCQFRAPAKPAPDQIASFTGLDVAKTAMIIKQLDMQPLLTNFFLDLARQIDDPAQITLFLELAERIAPPHVAIRFAKIAIQRGFPVEAYALPVLLPKFDIAGENGKIETAVLNALTRQESEFDVTSKSPVGARGLMQLMPGTARLVAANNKMKYELGRLSTDPSYNVTLGSAYLASLLGSFDGSYVLALAAYNAGPGRVMQWMKEFGDPRTARIDAVDWIERIPFTETREYVQRIMESTQLYRCRIEQGKVPIQLAQDLSRGRPGVRPPGPEITQSTPPQMVQ